MLVGCDQRPRVLLGAAEDRGHVEAVGGAALAEPFEEIQVPSRHARMMTDPPSFVLAALVRAGAGASTMILGASIDPCLSIRARPAPRSPRSCAATGGPTPAPSGRSV